MLWARQNASNGHKIMDTKQRKISYPPSQRAQLQEIVYILNIKIGPFYKQQDWKLMPNHLSLSLPNAFAFLKCASLKTNVCGGLKPKRLKKQFFV